LEEFGVLQYFQWKKVSEEMGVAKPDPLFFRMILDGLGLAPSEAVMVGDRLDHDILPARLLGMRAVRVLAGPYAEQVPCSPLHCPDRTIRSLEELPPALAAM
ncbi:TPA: HAD family hydrolase, partial [Candidatus Bipolaricaulota bacterium]|nr:HAD family hydrolase [Candidatus Bipolaricaulota bacterium]